MFKKLVLTALLLTFVSLASASLLTDDNRGIVKEEFLFNKKTAPLQQRSNFASGQLHRRRTIHARNNIAKRATVADRTIIPLVSKASDLWESLYIALRYLCRGCPQASFAIDLIPDKEVRTSYEVFVRTMHNMEKLSESVDYVSGFLEIHLSKGPVDDRKIVAAAIALVFSGMSGDLDPILQIVYEQSSLNAESFASSIATYLYGPAGRGVHFSPGIDISEVVSGVANAVAVAGDEAKDGKYVAELIKRVSSKQPQM